MWFTVKIILIKDYVRIEVQREHILLFKILLLVIFLF